MAFSSEQRSEPIRGEHHAPTDKRSLYAHTRRIVVTVVGVTVVLVGIALLALPGPGILVLIAGLALLASEYVWARRLLERARQMSKEAAQKVKGNSK